ncbi:hypothetical protein CR513_10355, partial [Mucuna pruriens]
MGKDHNKGLGLVKRDTQGVNAKVGALNRDNEKQKGPSMHESERSHDEVKQTFKCFDFNDRMKVKLVTLEFNGYALVWWNQVFCDVRRRRRPNVETWAELNFYNIIQRLYQGCKNMEDYFKEVEMAPMRA